MVERYVFLKLAEAHADAAGRAAVRDEVRRVFPGLPGVRGVRVGIPADAGAASAWDVVLIVSFDRVEDTSAYLTAPAHVAFADDFLAPRVAMKKAWNFEVGS